MTDSHKTAPRKWTPREDERLRWAYSGPAGTKRTGRLTIITEELKRTRTAARNRAIRLGLARGISTAYTEAESAAVRELYDGVTPNLKQTKALAKRLDRTLRSIQDHAYIKGLVATPGSGTLNARPVFTYSSRKCLYCGEQFQSAGPGNRRCGRCSKLAVFHGGVADLSGQF